MLSSGEALLFLGLDWSLPLSGDWPLLGDSPPLGPDLSLPEAGDAVQPPAVSVHLVPQLARVTVSHQGLETLDVGHQRLAQKLFQAWETFLDNPLSMRAL